MMGWSPRCYIPSFVEIGPPVLEKKIFKGFLAYSQCNLKSAVFSAKREKSKREIDNFSGKQREKGEISRRNFSAFRGEISRHFAAKMVIMTWVLKMYSPRFAAKLKP